MELLYIGKKAPQTFKMGYLSKEYTFKDTDEPVEVVTKDAKRMLAENPNMLKVVGDHGTGFELVEEDVLEIPVDTDPDDPNVEDADREGLEAMTKKEIGAFILEKYEIEIPRLERNKEAVISDALTIIAAG